MKNGRKLLFYKVANPDVGLSVVSPDIQKCCRFYGTTLLLLALAVRFLKALCVASFAMSEPL